MASWVSQDKLPTSFQNEVQSFLPNVVIRSNIQSIEDCNKWISEFALLTNTKWNVLGTRSPRSRIAFCKYLVCHRSSYHKTNPAELSKNQVCRNTGCEVKLKIHGKINTKSTRRTDPFIKKGLIGVIRIKGNHNHSLAAAEAGRFLPPTEENEETFVERFKDGMGVGDSRRFHETVLQLDEKITEADMSSRRTNPPTNAVHHWFERFRKPSNAWQRTTKELIEKLEGKSNLLEEKGTTIRFNEDPFALVVVTPMMKKAHELKSSGEAVFVDSTSSGDAEKHLATFLFCQCAAGAVPLALVVTKGGTVEAFAKGFELLKTAAEKLFHGKDGPSYFMVDESEVETKALSLVWPESETYRCTYKFLQMVWQQLWYSKHNDIPKEHRVPLMSSFQDVVYAHSPDEAETAYSNAFTLASSKIAGYHKWLKYIQDLWEKKEEWCLAFRTEEVRKHSESEFMALSVKIYKHLVFSLLKAYNVMTLLEFVSSHLEKHYRSKLRDFASVACPMLFLLSLRIKDGSAPQDVAEEVDENSYLVKTKYETFVVYTRSSCCSCRIRLQRRYCDHQYLVLENFPAVSRNFPQLTPEDKEEILALAQEYAPPTIKLEESFSADNVVIQDVVSLASETKPTPQLPSNAAPVEPRPPPVVPQRVGYYLMSVPSKPAIPPHFEEEERKRLLRLIKKRLSENDQKYKSSLSNLEGMLARLKAVNSPESWTAFVQGTRGSSVPGLLFNGSGGWQHLPVQPAPFPLVIPTGATLRRVTPAVFPSEAPAAKKSKTETR